MGFSKFEADVPRRPSRAAPLRASRGVRMAGSATMSLSGASPRPMEDCAGAFGGRNVPESMRAVEILGIIQASSGTSPDLEWGVPQALWPQAIRDTFEDINSDPLVADQLRHLYDHPDFVELYPGLVAEEAKTPMVPGVGIAPTYTISRGVLSDAVCLVRGDRHYTTDYNPRHLTNWGYNEVQYDIERQHTAASSTSCSSARSRTISSTTRSTRTTRW